MIDDWSRNAKSIIDTSLLKGGVIGGIIITAAAIEETMLSTGNRAGAA